MEGTRQVPQRLIAKLFWVGKKKIPRSMIVNESEGKHKCAITHQDYKTEKVWYPCGTREKVTINPILRTIWGE